MKPLRALSHNSLNHKTQTTRKVYEQSSTGGFVILPEIEIISANKWHIALGDIYK